MGNPLAESAIHHLKKLSVWNPVSCVAHVLLKDLGAGVGSRDSGYAYAVCAGAVCGDNFVVHLYAESMRTNTKCI